MVTYPTMHNGSVHIIYIYDQRKTWILPPHHHGYISFRFAVNIPKSPLIYSSGGDESGTPDSRKGSASKPGTLKRTAKTQRKARIAAADTRDDILKTGTIFLGAESKHRHLVARLMDVDQNNRLMMEANQQKGPVSNQNS